MADDDDEVEFVVEPDSEPISRSEYVTYTGGPSGAGGTVIAPAGWEQFSSDAADTSRNPDAPLLVRIADRNGDVEILTQIGKAWRAVDKSDRAASVKSIKPAYDR